MPHLRQCFPFGGSPVSRETLQPPQQDQSADPAGLLAQTAPCFSAQFRNPAGSAAAPRGSLGQIGLLRQRVSWGPTSNPSARPPRLTGVFPRGLRSAPTGESCDETSSHSGPRHFCTATFPWRPKHRHKGPPFQSQRSSLAPMALRKHLAQPRLLCTPGCHLQTRR